MLKVNVRVSLLLPFPHSFVDNYFSCLWLTDLMGIIWFSRVCCHCHTVLRLLLDLQISCENGLTVWANAVCKVLGKLPSTTCLDFWERRARGQTGGWSCVGKGRDNQVRLVGAWRLCQRFLFMKALCFPRATSQSQTQASLGFPFRTCHSHQRYADLRGKDGAQSELCPHSGVVLKAWTFD